MSSLDKMITSSKKRRSPDLLVSNSKKVQSPDLLTSGKNLTSSQKHTVCNIKFTAEDTRNSVKNSRKNGILITTRTLVEARNYSMANYKMSHKIKMVRNQNAKDPTWAQLKQFLKTNVMFKNKFNDKISYRLGEFMCSDFSQTLYNNANATGIRCADVSVMWNNGKSHAMCAFNTTDYGLVFVDPTNNLLCSENNFFSQGAIRKQYKPDFADYFYIDTGAEYANAVANLLSDNGGMFSVYIDW